MSMANEDEYGLQSIDELVLLLAIVEEGVKCVVDEGCDSIGASHDGAQFDEELREPVIEGLDLNDESVNVVVEVEGGHVVDLEGVVVVGVLVGPGLPEEVVRVDGGDDVDVVVADVGVRRPPHVVQLLVPAQLRQHGLTVLPLNPAHALQVPEEQKLNLVRHVQSLDDVVDAQPRVDVLVGVAADVEVPRHLLDREVAAQLAPVPLLEGRLGSLVLLLLVGLREQLEGTPGRVEQFAVTVEAELADGAEVGGVRHHGVLDVQRDDLAGEARQHDAEVDLLHLPPRHQLPRHDRRPECGVHERTDLHEQEVGHAQHRQDRQHAAAVRPLLKVLRHLLEDVQLPHAVPDRHIQSTTRSAQPTPAKTAVRTGQNRSKEGVQFYYMSFGEHAYQHRFHQPLKGKARPELPLLPARSPVLLSPYAPRDHYDDYLYNSLLIDSFKRDADYRKIHRRLRSLNPHVSYAPYYPYAYPSQYYDGLPLAPTRIVTEPAVQAPQVVYVNKETPDVLPALMNYSAMASRVHEAEREAERAQTQVAEERQQLREYRHKYSRLKSRLREEMAEARRARDMEERRAREAEAAAERRLEEVGQAVAQMSQQVSNNSRIMEQNLKLREELELSQDRVLVFPTVPTVLSRSAFLERPALDSQYQEMRRLRKQIGELDRKLGYTSQ